MPPVTPSNQPRSHVADASPIQDRRLAIFNILDSRRSPIISFNMATPVKSTRADVSPIPDSPGTWRHPRLNEITRRRNAATFSEKNVRRIACNVIALLVMWSLQLLARLKVDLQMFSSTFSYYMGWAWFAMQLLPFIQIGLACLPLLLGLPATSVPLTPEARYSTPPRYSRTPSIAGSIITRIVEHLWRKLVCQLIRRYWLAEPVNGEADKRRAK
ncbi:hypothetical protein G6O67_000258 [Ophiocordyceps sinensis]|uniref:Nucleoporin POM34 n=1 Tax=Ophiocordyceps sinensis TaxID=72228 RepID=A0A8H4V9S5_9HYPO|nr:hypothetical protein G6O67_000258 [Ophiocordyceps sinensis]